MLAELTRKREAQKLKQAQVIQDVFSTALFPHGPQMRLAFETIMTFVLLLHAVMQYLAYVPSQ
jgi:NuA3 HAT complex component NTO1